MAQNDAQQVLKTRPRESFLFRLGDTFVLAGVCRVCCDTSGFEAGEGFR